MTREDIIGMAREADPGFAGGPDADGTMGDSIVGLEAIERFAALVAAAEREACAKVCENGAIRLLRHVAAVLQYKAAAIRARGNA